MGCASSKRIEATVEAYRPAPTSFAVFDIDSIEEPWLINSRVDDAHIEQQQHQEKPPRVPEQLLQKLIAIDDAPRSWDEVKKDLENLKPTLQNSKPPVSNSNLKSGPLAIVRPPQAPPQDSDSQVKRVPRKSFSFHTLDELDAKAPTKEKQSELRKSESMRPEMKKRDSVAEAKKLESNERESSRVTESSTGGYKPVKDNIFIIKDKQERQKEGKSAPILKRDPLSDYPDICPPGGSDSVVLYTTSLGGVRRTFEDCNRVRSILELHGVVFDERDVSLHGKFLNEVKELLGEERDSSVPRMFVKGKYVGGVEEVVGLNETGRLGRILSWARVERGMGRQGCAGCGGVRFVPCLECGGSCKVVVEEKKVRCEECNENGLVHCPACA